VVIRAGVIDRGRTVRDASLLSLGAAVADALPFVGAANVQCRVVNGVPIVFEINPRFSGGIPLTIAAGADFPRMLVDLAAGRSVAPAIGHFRDDLWMTKFESAMFLDAAEAAGQPRANPVTLGDVA
jgi:carbamoyl-phosphate synthase large subunit